MENTTTTKKPLFPIEALRPAVIHSDDVTLTFSYRRASYGILASIIVIPGLAGIIASVAALLLLGIKEQIYGLVALGSLGVFVIDTIFFLAIQQFVSILYRWPFVTISSKHAEIGFYKGRDNVIGLISSRYSLEIRRYFVVGDSGERDVMNEVYLHDETNCVLIEVESEPSSLIERWMCCDRLCRCDIHDSTASVERILGHDVRIDWWWLDRSSASFRQKDILVRDDTSVLITRSLATKIFGYGIALAAVTLPVYGGVMAFMTKVDGSLVGGALAVCIVVSVCATLGWWGLAIGQGRAGNEDLEIDLRNGTVWRKSYMLWWIHKADSCDLSDIAAVQLILDDVANRSEVCLVRFGDADRIKVVKGQASPEMKSFAAKLAELIKVALFVGPE